MSARRSGSASRESEASSQSGGEYVLDGSEDLVAGLAELVHEVPVAVFGQRRGAGAVVAAFEHFPDVELLEQGSDLRGREVSRSVVAGDTFEDPGHLGGVEQHHVVGASVVEGAEYPQVLDAFLRGRE